ncbi:MAG: ferredoxin III, nif-specific [Colwellia sp.]
MSVKAYTRSGQEWDPEFVTVLNQNTCLGCGRCYKVCPRDVFDLIEREIDEDDDMYDDEDDDVVMVMALANEDDCIGCGSCSRVCPKKCHSHQTYSQLES